MPELIKNMPFGEPVELAGMVDYQDNQVVSRTLAQNSSLSITLFAFDVGEGISAHTVPADALVVILDGEAQVTIGDKVVSVSAGQTIAMPQGVPHALDAKQRFKMMLFVVRSPQTTLA